MANIVPYNQELYQVGHLMGDSLITNSTQKPVMRFYYGYPQFNNPLAYIDRGDITSVDAFLNNSKEYIKWSDYISLKYQDNPSLSMLENLLVTADYLPKSTDNYYLKNAYLYSIESIADSIFPGIEVNFKQNTKQNNQLSAMVCIWSSTEISELFNTKLLGVLFVNNYFDAQIFIPMTISDFIFDNYGNHGIYWSFHTINNFNYSNFIRNFRIKLLPGEITATRGICYPEPVSSAFARFFKYSATTADPNAMNFGPTFNNYTINYGPRIGGLTGYDGFMLNVVGSKNYTFNKYINIHENGVNSAHNPNNYWPGSSGLYDFFREIGCTLFGPLILPKQVSQEYNDAATEIYNNNPWKITISYDYIDSWEIN